MIHNVLSDNFLDFLHLSFVEVTVFSVAACSNDRVTGLELVNTEKQMCELLRNLVSLDLWVLVEGWHSPLGVSENCIDADNRGGPVHLRL